MNAGPDLFSEAIVTPDFRHTAHRNSELFQQDSGHSLINIYEPQNFRNIQNKGEKCIRGIGR